MKQLLLAALATTLCAGLAAEEEVILQITGFLDDSPLQAAGAEEGDVILHYAGHRVKSLDHLSELRDGVSGEVEVILLRGAESLRVSIPAGSLGVYLRVFDEAHEIAPDAVRIEGIGRLGWEHDMYNSFLGCVYRLDEKFGRGLLYQDILGLSGYAFRFHMFTQSLCPSSPDATCGFDTGYYVLRTLGYDVEPLLLASSEIGREYKQMARSQGELEERMMQGIDAGWPTIGIDIVEIPEWGIVTGYQRDGEEFFCRSYFDTTADYNLIEKFPWSVYIVKGYSQNDLSDAYRASLQKACEMLETPAYHDYKSGLAGFDQWIMHLENVATVNMDEAALLEAMHANWWAYINLFIARKFAGDYLNQHADKFGLPPGDVDTLLAIYGKEVGLLLAGMGDVPNNLEGAVVADWTSTKRRNQIETLRELRKLEEQALEILRKA